MRPGCPRCLEPMTDMSSMVMDDWPRWVCRNPKCESGAAKPAPSLADWWERTSRKDLEQMLPKIEEYSAIDLEIMGAAMEAAFPKLPKGAGKEFACQFYLLGKVARAIGAFMESRLPSADTYKDETAYSKMARRIREAGTWP